MAGCGALPGGGGSCLGRALLGLGNSVNRAAGFACLFGSASDVLYLSDCSNNEFICLSI